MSFPPLVDAARAIVRAAQAGVNNAANAFGAELRASGKTVTHANELDGTATIALEGAGAVAHEFGTLKTPAQPVLSPALHAQRHAVVRAVAAHIGHALKRK